MLPFLCSEAQFVADTSSFRCRSAAFHCPADFPAAFSHASILRAQTRVAPFSIVNLASGCDNNNSEGNRSVNKAEVGSGF